MRSISDYLETKLIVNRAKTKVAKLSQCSFLGFVITAKRIGCLETKLKAFKQAIRQITSRSWSIAMRKRLDIMDNTWLAKQGCPSIKNKWVNLRYPNG